MGSNPFQATLRRPSDSTAVILELSRDIAGSAERALDQAYRDAVVGNPTKVVLNFVKVRYINSTGIALVVGVLMRARNEQIVLTACGLSEHYREIFEITRLSEFMPVYADEMAALADEPAAA